MEERNVSMRKFIDAGAEETKSRAKKKDCLNHRYSFTRGKRDVQLFLLLINNINNKRRKKCLGRPGCCRWQSTRYWWAVESRDSGLFVVT